MDATTTFNQLTQSENGVNRLVSMIGAKHLSFSEKDSHVSFKFMRGAKNKANYLKIMLTPADTYTLEFGKIHGLKYRVIETLAGVYAEDLKRIFESETGLYLSL
jgi:hypothetical protein